MSPAVNHHHHLTSRHSLVCILCCCLHWASIRCRWNSDGLVAAANVHHRNLRKLRSGHPWSFLTPYRTDYYSGKLRGVWILIHLFCFFIMVKSITEKFQTYSRWLPCASCCTEQRSRLWPRPCRCGRTERESLSMSGSREAPWSRSIGRSGAPLSNQKTDIKN